MPILFEDFLRCCEELVDDKDTFNIRWYKKEINSIPFLVGNHEVCKTSIPEKQIEETNFQFHNELYFDEDAVSVSHNEVIKMNFNIVYSVSYKNPILYFNVHRSNGSLLNLQEIWQIIPNIDDYENKLEFITQTEHPLLMSPFYHIHPCHTDELLKPVVQLNEANKQFNYVRSWLSFVLSVLGVATL